jgi:putative tryptophan/tyrosine transport system substrate-binding protein
MPIDTLCPPAYTRSRDCSEDIIMMRRTVRLLVTLPLGFLVVLLAAHAAHAGKRVRIGWLWPFPPPDPARGSGVSRVLFPQVMAELGWVEGQNLCIDHRYAELQYERLPALAAELVQLQPDALIGQTAPATLALKQATTTIPIVMIAVGDAAQEGLVANLARPGGNVTGVSSLDADVVPKRLELLLILSTSVCWLALRAPLFMASRVQSRRRCPTPGPYRR